MRDRRLFEEIEIWAILNKELADDETVADDTTLGGWQDRTVEMHDRVALLIPEDQVYFQQFTKAAILKVQKLEAAGR